MLRDILYALASGPFMWVAFGIFFGGLIFQIVRFFVFTRRIPRIRFAAGGRFDPGAAAADAPLTQIGRQARRKTTLVGVDPAMFCVCVVFHASFFLVALFDNAHIEVLALSWGVRLPAVAESISHVAIVLFFISAGVYLLRRMVVARVRAISAVSDYAVLALAVAPVLTGHLAAHHYLDYRWMMLMHILSSQLLLIVLPFSKLGHMVFFFLNRWFISHEYGFGRGGRQWPLSVQGVP